MDTPETLRTEFSGQHKDVDRILHETGILCLNMADQIAGLLERPKIRPLQALETKKTRFTGIVAASNG